jgi:hypothetical protein
MEVDNQISGSSTKAEQETLYLIYKYLESFTPCKEASSKLKDELQQNFLLGDVYSWDGSRKKADIKDMDRKYSHIPNDMLLALLRKTSAVENPTPHTSIITTGNSFSHNPSVDDLKVYHDMLAQLTTIVVNQSKHRSEIVKTETKLTKLNELIELHTNYDETSGIELPPDIDTSAFMTHLTAQDYAEIYAKDSSLPEPQQQVHTMRNGIVYVYLCAIHVLCVWSACEYMDKIM